MMTERRIMVMLLAIERVVDNNNGNNGNRNRECVGIQACVFQ